MSSRHMIDNFTKRHWKRYIRQWLSSGRNESRKGNLNSHGGTKTSECSRPPKSSRYLSRENEKWTLQALTAGIARRLSLTKDGTLSNRIKSLPARTQKCNSSRKHKFCFSRTCKTASFALPAPNPQYLSITARIAYLNSIAISCVFTTRPSPHLGYSWPVRPSYRIAMRLFLRNISLPIQSESRTNYFLSEVGKRTCGERCKISTGSKKTKSHHTSLLRNNEILIMCAAYYQDHFLYLQNESI